MNEWELTSKEIEKAWDIFVSEHPGYQWDSNMAGKAIAHESQKKLMKYIFDNMRVNELDGEAWKKLCVAFIEEG